MRKAMAVTGIIFCCCIIFTGTLFLSGKILPTSPRGSTSASYVYKSGYATFGADFYTYVTNNAADAAAAGQQGTFNQVMTFDLMSQFFGYVLIALGGMGICLFGILACEPKKAAPPEIPHPSGRENAAPGPERHQTDRGATAPAAKQARPDRNSYIPAAPQQDSGRDSFIPPAPKQTGRDVSATKTGPYSQNRGTAESGLMQSRSETKSGDLQRNERIPEPLIYPKQPEKPAGTDVADNKGKYAQNEAYEMVDLIVDTRFNKTTRGYDPDEVDIFLDEVCDEIEKRAEDPSFTDFKITDKTVQFKHFTEVDNGYDIYQVNALMKKIEGFLRI